MPSFFYIIVSVLLNVFGQISIKIGTTKIGAITLGAGKLASTLFNVFTNLYIDGGLALYVLSSIFWIAALSKNDLSYAYPFLSIGYILILIFSYFILREHISAYRIAGICLITIGLFLIAKK